jgi:DNA-binding MarR family transcriptional regulator
LPRRWTCTRRWPRASPTRKGKETLAALRRVRFDELAAVLTRLTGDERAELIRLFRKMAE